MNSGAIDSAGTALVFANPSDASERSPARDVPWPIANPSAVSRSKCGRRPLWKRRQISRANDAKINNDDDAVTDSEAITGLDAHTDASAMQLAAISRASFYQKMSTGTVCPSTPVISSAASTSSPTSSPPRSVFPSIDGSTSPGGCPPPADDAGIAETGLRQAQFERQQIDSFGRDANLSRVDASLRSCGRVRL